MPAYRVACLLALLLTTPAWGQVVMRPASDGGPAAAMASVQQLVQSNPAVAQVSLVRVDVDALKTAARGQDLQFMLSGTRTATFRTREVQPLEDHRFAWSGESTGKGDFPPGTATLVVDGSEVTGSITTQDGKPYQLRPAGSGLTALIEIDTGKLPPEDEPIKENKNGRTQAPPPRAGGTRSGQTPVIDIVVAYTSAAEKASGNINSLIDLAVVESNQTFVNSRIDARFRVVDRMRVDYSESGKSYEQMNNDLAAMPQVKARREARYAAVAMLLVDNNELCGRAENIGATAEDANIVVNQSCATGSSYTVAHEIGHLAGARHDVANDPTNTPYAYGHGYRNEPLWGTIMAYACDPWPHCPNIPYWSNPKVEYLFHPTGTESRENVAAVWKERAPQMEGFRSPKLWKKAIDGIYSDMSCATPQRGSISCYALGAKQQVIRWSTLNFGVQWTQWDAKPLSPDGPVCLTTTLIRDDCFAADQRGVLVHGMKILAEPVKWETLGGNILGRPACLSTEPGMFDCFVRWTDGGIHLISWRHDRAGEWRDLHFVADSDLGCLAGAVDPFDCFARGKDGRMWQLSWDGTTANWQDRGGGITGRPECLSWGPNRIDCFAQGDDNGGHGLHHIAANGNQWAGWDSRGGGLYKHSGISCTSRAKDHLDCFMGGAIPGIYHYGWDVTDWTGWQELGGWSDKTPTCISSQPDRIECFMRAPFNTLFYKYWDGNAWHPQTDKEVNAP